MFQVFRFQTKYYEDGKLIDSGVCSYVTTTHCSIRNVFPAVKDINDDLARDEYWRYAMKDECTQLVVYPIPTLWHGNWTYGIPYADYYRDESSAHPLFDDDYILNEDDTDEIDFYRGSKRYYSVQMCEGYDFQDLPVDLQHDVAEEITGSNTYDTQGSGWHDYADNEEDYLAERLKERGFNNAKIYSTQSFCCQGDSTCIVFDGIDLDKLIKAYPKELSFINEKRHYRWIAEHLLHFAQYTLSHSWDVFSYFHCEYAGDNLMGDWDEYISATPIHRYTYTENARPRLYKICKEIENAIENIADRENYQAHKDMHNAFDYWYGADGVLDYLEGANATLVYDGNKWDWSV